MDIIKRNRPETTQPEIKKYGRIVVLAGAFLSVFLALGISQIQGLSFFNIFQSVLGFLAPPMSVAFLFAVLWRRTSGRGIKITLSAGTAFSLGIGVLYYTNIIFNGVHYLYVSVLIFIILNLFLLIYSLLDKKEDTDVRLLNFKPVKV